MTLVASFKDKSHKGLDVCVKSFPFYVSGRQILCACTPQDFVLFKCRIQMLLNLTSKAALPISFSYSEIAHYQASVDPVV